MTSAVRHITIDALDPYALAQFWAQVVLGRLQDDDHPGDPEVLVTHAGTPLLFVQVPESKTVKNRVHLDLRVGADRVDAEVERLQALGATWAWETVDRGPRNVTMQDPEGNELCLS